MPDEFTSIEYNQYLDAKGLNCPLPILKAKLALNLMTQGDVLCVEATDPHSTIDFKAYCARSGHELIHTDTMDNVITFYIKKRSGDHAP